MGSAFYIVDVFAEKKYEGNQLAVVRSKALLPDADMQRIAREIHYSETAFVLSEKERNGGYDVRIFTPEMEVPFAGHPVLGTAYVLQQEIVLKPVQKLILNLKIGQIPVTITYREDHPDILWMTQQDPTFGETFSRDRLARILGLPPAEIDDRFPIQEVSTGLPAIIVPLKTLNAAKKVCVAKELYFELVKDTNAKLILVFCPQTYDQENDLNVRVFGHYYGIPEDPATGSGNGCLAGYLVSYRYFGKAEIDIRVEQGYEIGRPSLLYLKSMNKKGKIDTCIGGKVMMVARGELV